MFPADLLHCAWPFFDCREEWEILRSNDAEKTAAGKDGCPEFSIARVLPEWMVVDVSAVDEENLSSLPSPRITDLSSAFCLCCHHPSTSHLLFLIG